MLPKTYLTSYSRMSGSRWLTTPSWLSKSLRSFFVYVWHTYTCTFFCVYWMFCKKRKEQHITENVHFINYALYLSVQRKEHSSEFSYFRSIWNNTLKICHLSENILYESFYVICHSEICSLKIKTLRVTCQRTVSLAFCVHIVKLFQKLIRGSLF